MCFPFVFEFDSFIRFVVSVLKSWLRVRVGEGCLAGRGTPGDGRHQGLCCLALEGCSDGFRLWITQPFSPQSTVKLLLKTATTTTITKSLQLCPTLCDPIDCKPARLLRHGIFQARILEWFATPSSRGSSQLRDWTQGSYTAGKFFTVWATRESPLGSWGTWAYKLFLILLLWLVLEAPLD